MFRSTLVAQLLTFVLDTQGADMQSVMEMFPEEFSPRAQKSESASRHAFPWIGASADLTDSVRFLEARHLIEIHPDGTIAVADSSHAATDRSVARHEGLAVQDPPAVSYRSVEPAGGPSDERLSVNMLDEGWGYAPMLEWNGGEIRLAEHVDPLEFDQPRFES